MIESSIQARVGRAIILSTCMTPDRVDEDHYIVRSSDGRRDYYVDLESECCTCPDSINGHTCKHVFLATIHQAKA